MVRLPQVGGGGGGAVYIVWCYYTATVCKFVSVCFQTIWVVVDGAATKSSFRDSFFLFGSLRYAICAQIDHYGQTGEFVVWV